MEIKLKKLLRINKTSTGAPLYIFEVETASEEALAKFKKAQGEHYTTDKETQKPVYMTQFPSIEGTELKVSEKSGKIYADNSEMEKTLATAKALGCEDAVKAELAKDLVAKLLKR